MPCGRDHLKRLFVRKADALLRGMGERGSRQIRGGFGDGKSASDGCGYWPWALEVGRSIDRGRLVGPKEITTEQVGILSGLNNF